MSDNKYQGWTNYETWAVKLWIDNEEGSSDYWRERARDAYRAAKPSLSFTQREQATLDLSHELKDEIEEVYGALEASDISDLDDYIDERIECADKNIDASDVRDLDDVIQSNLESFAAKSLQGMILEVLQSLEVKIVLDRLVKESITRVTQS